MQPTQPYHRVSLQQQPSQLLNNPSLKLGVDYVIEGGVGYLIRHTPAQVNTVITGK